MAKIIQTVNNIMFDDVEELAKAAVKYLKRKLIKHKLDESSVLISSIVSSRLGSAEGQELDRFISQLSSDIAEIGFNGVPEGTTQGCVCGFDAGVAMLEAGYAFEIRPNCMGLYNIVELDTKFDVCDNICMITCESAMSILQMALAGKFVFANDSFGVSLLISPAAKAKIAAQSEKEVTQTASVLDVVTDADVEQVLAEPAPASITLHIGNHIDREAVESILPMLDPINGPDLQTKVD